jgi:hypothetical protein
MALFAVWRYLLGFVIVMRRFHLSRQRRGPDWKHQSADGGQMHG